MAATRTNVRFWVKADKSHGACLLKGLGHVLIEVDIDCSGKERAPRLHEIVRDRVASELLACKLDGSVRLILDYLNELGRIIGISFLINSGCVVTARRSRTARRRPRRDAGNPRARVGHVTKSELMNNWEFPGARGAPSFTRNKIAVIRWGRGS
jgi:hypothetical protein